MQFDMEEFVNQKGSFVTALNIIDSLVGILNDYIADDETASGFGSGCYGKGAEDQIFNRLKERDLDRYIIRRGKT
jgi:hypothetical protein